MNVLTCGGAVLLAAIAIATTADAQSQSKRQPAAGWLTFWATAYCVDGTTRSGAQTKPGTIAADPKVLPLGSRVQIERAGRRGTYTVLDTGPAVKGREIDIFISDCRAAKRFGKQKVRLRILRRGPSEAARRKTPPY